MRAPREVEKIITTVFTMLNPFDQKQNCLLSLASGHGLSLMTMLLIVCLEQNKLERINF